MPWCCNLMTFCYYLLKFISNQWRNTHYVVAIIYIKIRIKHGCGNWWVLGVEPMWSVAHKHASAGLRVIPPSIEDTHILYHLLRSYVLIIWCFWKHYKIRLAAVSCGYNSPIYNWYEVEYHVFNRDSLACCGV